MKFCIVSCIGINTAYQLLMRGRIVKMITKNTESVGSIYSKYIVLSMPKMQRFKNIHFKIDNLNIF